MHSIFLTLLLAKMVADNCPLCSQTQLWKAPRWGRMPLGDRPYSFGKRFFITGPLPLPGTSRYETTVVGNFTGPTLASPSRNTASRHIISLFSRDVLILFGHCRVRSRYRFASQAVQSYPTSGQHWSRTWNLTEFPPSLLTPSGQMYREVAYSETCSSSF